MGTDKDDATRVAAEAEHKRLATLRAGLALKGYELHDTADAFIVRRWGLTRLLNGLESVEQFARQVGAA